ncbi:MAG: hypothetical protein EOO28_24470 [Comamonadaceae bacterium]|nr:MAG: hypothetical protein EOO28_24470 [Comamonadaceae bacterium]
MTHSSQPSASLEAGSTPSFDGALVQDDRLADIELGFECANPWLQIETWGQDASAKPGYFS